ncbi:hypothetical protein CONPUDRAFT_160689 [Coniophora puteana RWD-64-598 SS2]|uniref:Uncharacterized protein n=1 Tax=Coniophora puteana (strain RWD-64-598) TaxID=741705 RepID=R7SCB1_CONPW|nr:uncharacterized protein CONPUDRAFT_160689 [Coniophora puteana RWD-64-598 SS2]EIW73811.1 hypothetical protein CONPUDRAFT_160689 [Coniophora puteana RWD-64-598 SS2]
MTAQDFVLKEGANVLTPQDALELPRAGGALANPSGDLVIVPISKYTFGDRKTAHSLVVVALDSGQEPLSFPLPNGGEAFWLDDVTLAVVIEAASGKTYNVNFGEIRVLYWKFY